MARTRSEGEMAQEEQSFKAYLDTLPKEKIIIPEDPLNPDDVVPIGCNGVIYAVPRGREFEVPNVIAEIWRNAYMQTNVARKRMDITEKKDLVVTG